MNILETDFRIDYNPKWAKIKPETKDSLWLWSIEKDKSRSKVSRSLYYLKILVNRKGFSSNISVYREAIRMIENKEIGEVKY